MLLHVQRLFTRLAVSKRVVFARGIGHSAVMSKTAALAATAGRKKAVARQPATKVNKPKTAKSKAKAKLKPKVKMAKKPKVPTKKAMLEAMLSKKKPLLPLPPKGPISSYNVFSKEKFNEIAKSYGPGAPTQVLASVSRSVAQLWRDMDAAAKQVYTAKLAKQREEHVADLRRWWSTADRALVDLENKRRRRHNLRLAKSGSGKRSEKLALLQDPFAPKRPPTAYGIFVTERTKGQAGVKLGEVSAELGAEWNRMGEAQKAPYVSEYKERVEQYKQDHQRYSAGLARS
ncbi:hypothetical protein GGI15_001390 [Coemansia interrupta]|uniref:HMG box domain-containing protein n=1 Tax=Coemansia interrupta TaxID=1126814 RepID=A0A9W8HK25_9FUNG|nr:hypothetical protein GGI15_001390 [Coemansia interrupta]